MTRAGSVPPRRIGLPQMLRAGVRAVTDYTGTFLGLFCAQVLLALGAGFVVAQILADAFHGRPRFDEGIDGDLAALIEALRHAGATVSAIGWVGAGAILLWVMLSWFLAGGLIAVLAERPHGRRETARTFGAGGATHFFVLARLGALSLFLHALILIVAMIGVGAVYPRIERALELGEVVAWLALGLGPALVLVALLWAVIDYARVELVVRRATHDRLGALVAFGRAVAFVVHRPLAIGHLLLWAAAFLVVSVLYAWASHGSAMPGTSGAISLLMVRQGLALVRMGLKIVAIGGQVELGMTRPPPPRAVKVEAE
jgi:hypothetical protein